MLLKTIFCLIICIQLILLSCSSYSPQLLSFSYDWSVGNLTMYFDSLMSIPSLDLSRVELYTYNISETHMFPLSHGFNNLTKQGNSTSAFVLLPTDTYAALKTDGILSQDNSRLFIYMKMGSILTPFGDPVVATNVTDDLRVSHVKNDTLSPFVASYGLDMDSGELSLTFTEPININTFTLRGLALQASRNSKIAPEQWKQYYQLDDYHSSIVSLTNFKRTLTANLGEYNLNIIKSIIGLANTFENTYLSAWQPFVNDTSGNVISLVAFDYLHGIKPIYYQPDITAPYLTQWHFDMNDAALSLFFSETVYIDFFNFSAIQLTNGNGVFVRLHEPVNRTDISTHIVRMNLNDQQMRFIQAIDNFFVSENTTYIVLEENIVVDTSVNQNPYSSIDATEANPMKVGLFVPDITQPRLLQFDLDLEAQEMILHFSKAMKLSSIDFQHLRLQAAQDSLMETEFMVLSAHDVTLVSAYDTPDVVMRLSDLVIKRFRMHALLGKSISTTYVAIFHLFITDRAPARNMVVDVTTANALQVHNFVPDSAQPYLTSWTIDLDLNMIYLNFSKPLEVNAIDLSAAYLSSDGFLLASTFKLSLGDSLVTTTAATKVAIVEIQLSTNAILHIKDVVGFCSSVNDCYLSFSPKLGHSLILINRNSSITYADVESVSFLSPTVYIPDDIPPELLSFTFDAQLGMLLLQYDELVRTSTFNFSNLVLYSTSVSHGLTLSPRTMAEEAIDSVIHIVLTQYDLLKVSALYPLGQDKNTTRLYLNSRSVQDVLGNFATSKQLIANEVISTKPGPKLLSVYVDVTVHRNLTLYFSLYMDISNLVLSEIFLVATSGQAYSLAGARIITMSSITPTLLIDLSPIRTSVLQPQGLAQSQSSTYIAIQEGANLHEAHTSQTSASLITVSAKTPLREGLNVLSFVMNMLDGTIVLEMSFPIDISTINPTDFQISNGATMYQLQSTTAFVVDHKYRTLVISLSAQDHHAVQEKLRLVVAKELQIQIESTGIIDIHGKELSLTTTTLICSQLIVDTSSPVIQAYQINLQAGLLTIFLSKPVVISTINLENTITIVNALTPTTQSLTLQDIALDSSLVGIYMSDKILLNLNLGHPITTREQLQVAYPMGNVVDQTFLTVGKGFVYDNSVPPNPSAYLSVQRGLKPTTVVFDTVKPELLTYAVDLTQRILYINFTEAVNIHTFRIDVLTFGARPTNLTVAHYTLTLSSTMRSITHTSNVAIQISIGDYNQMMDLAPRLLINMGETFLSFEDTTFTDLSTPANGNEPVYFRYGIQATSFLQDHSPPVLLSYNVSIIDGYIDMLFHKVVNCQNIHPEMFLFQSQSFLGNILWDTGIELNDYILRLSNASYCLGINYNPQIRIMIDYQDLMRIKGSSFVLKSKESTYLRFDTGAIYDVFDNTNTALGDDEGILVQHYERDPKLPQLLAYTVTTTKSLFLFFDKPVDLTTLQISQLTLQNRQDLTQTLSYPLQAASFYRKNFYKTIFEFDLLSDFMRIFGVTFILHNQPNTFLRIDSPQFVSDYFGNTVNMFYNASNGLNIGPKVIAWDFEGGDGYLQFEFNEPVASGFRLTGVTIQATDVYESGVTNHVVLTSTFPAVRVGTTTYHCYLNAFDLNAIKLSGLIPSYQLVDENYIYHTMQLYLATPFAMAHTANPDGLIQNLSSVPTYRTQALPIRYYSIDTIPPKCKYFDLDLENGVMAITFSEAIDMPTIDYAGIILYSSKNGEFYVFDYQQNNSYPTLQQQVILHIQLYENDLTLIKYLNHEGYGFDRLMISRNAVQDVFGNKYLGNDMDHPIFLRNFVADSSPPQLLHYSVFFNSEDIRLRLIFDEMIDMKSFDIRNLVLLSSSNISFSLSDITESYRHTPDVRGYHGTIHNVTYMMLSTYTLYNYTYEYIVNANQAMDKELLRTIDIDIGFLKYDEFALELLSKQSVMAYGDGSGALSPPFYRSLETSYLMIYNLSDVFGHFLQHPAIYQATEFYPQSISTTVDLEAFDFYEEASGSTILWTLYFNNIIDISTFDCSDFIFISSRSQTPSYTKTLHSTDCHLITLSNSHVIQVQVASSLFPTRLGYDRTETFLQTASVNSVTRDINGHGASIVSYLMAIQLGPQLLKTSVDMSTGEVILLFSKDVDESSFRYVQNIGFYSSITRSSFMLSRVNTTAPINHVVAGQYFTTYVNGNDTVIRFRLEEHDFYEIKLLKVKYDSFFVNIFQDAVYDATSHGVNSRNKFPVARIIPDYHNPLILNITLDMGKEMLSIWFNEPIDIDSIEMSAIRLQAYASTTANATDIYDLTGGTVTRNLNQLDFKLSHVDATNIKLNPFIANAISSSYFSVKVGAMTDMNGNYLPSISISSARLVDAYIPDTVNPVLESFTLNIHDPQVSYLTLYFSEPVVAAMINITAITIQSRYTLLEGVGYTLTGGMVLSDNSDVIMIELLAEDVLQMKLIPGLIRKIQQTYIVSTSDLVVDLEGNAIDPRVDGAALACTTYLADTSSPVIEETNLDMQNGILTIYLNEPVDVPTVDVTTLTLISTRPHTDADPYSAYTLTSDSLVTQSAPLATVVIITLSEGDFNSIKSHYPLAMNQSSVFFTFTSAFMHDFVGNTIDSRSHSTAVHCANFIQDTIRPSIIGYSLNMNAKSIHLTFSEAVNQNRVILQHLIVQNSFERRLGKSIACNKCVYAFGNDANSTTMTIFFDEIMVKYMKYYEIGYSRVTSYLSWGDWFVTDYAGNQILPEWDGSIYGFTPKLPEPFYPDSQSPNLLRWYLDRKNFTMSMYFDEPVRLLNVSSIHIIRSRTAPVAITHSDVKEYPLMSTAWQYFDNNTQIMIALTDYCVGGSFETIMTITDVIYIVCSNQVETMFNYMNATSSQYTLSIPYNISIVDFAKNENSINQTFPLAEEQPDCTTCPANSFVTRNCSTSWDRVCQPCITCGKQHYIHETCESYRDTSCAACSVCPFGEYIQQSCTAQSNTVCAKCDVCPAMTFPSRFCTLGYNTICDTCEVCQFPDNEAKQYCEAQAPYKRWKEKHCCKDPHGRTALCKELLNYQNKGTGVLTTKPTIQRAT